MSATTVPETPASVEQAISNISTIATLPEVTTRILAVVDDPQSSARQLHDIVSHDPALVSRILKIVNSAFYGLPGQIATVERAIVLLGTNAVRNIAVSASLGQLFRGSAILYEGCTARDLWYHCVAVGLVARELTRKMKLPLADEAFLAGMIHDIGLLVWLQTCPARLRETCEQARTSPASFCEIETQSLGTDHQHVGAILCERWRFPRSCQLVAGYHHRPAQLSAQNRLLVTLVHAADTLCCAEKAGFSLTAQHQKVEDSDPAAVGLDPSLIEPIRNSLPTLLSEAGDLFG